MTYAVKEIFYTLQGEGAHTGRPAVFCRFAGCNLWTGREQDRAERGLHSSATPTSSAPTAPAAASSPPPTTLADAVAATWPAAANGRGRPLVVCTGGEPLLQTRRRADRRRCTQRGFEIAVETNGTLPAPAGTRLGLRQPQGRRPRRC